METWIKINDFPNYSISNFGNVRNDVKNSLIKGGVKNGYKFVNLSKEGFTKSITTHRLVASHFLNFFDKSLDIDHINRDKTDNRVDNLRCVSRADNLRNKNKKSGCSSSYKGVSLLKNGKWRASGYLNKNVFNLGHFDTEEEASEAVTLFNKDKGIEIQ